MARVILFIFVGLILGGIMSEALGALFGELGVILNAGGYDNSVHHIFTATADYSIGLPDNGTPIIIDLYLVKFALGIGFKFSQSIAQIQRITRKFRPCSISHIFALA